MLPSAHILVEDPSLADALDAFLAAHDYVVAAHASADDLLRAPRPMRPVAAILDIFLWTAPAQALSRWLGRPLSAPGIVGLSARSAHETASRSAALAGLRIVRLPFDGAILTAALAQPTPTVPPARSRALPFRADLPVPREATGRS